MTPDIQIGIDSNAAAIVRRLDAFPDAMAQAIAKAFDRENELTIGQIQAQKLSRRGPMTLGVVTNRLRSSIRRTDATTQGTSVTSAIGSNVIYAGVHEFGIDRTVTVRAHRARHGALDVFSIKGGRTVRGWELVGALAETGAKRASRVAEGFVTVRAHTMHMHFPARAYIRSTIDERAGNYSQAISDAIVSAWGGAN